MNCVHSLITSDICQLQLTKHHSLLPQWPITAILCSLKWLLGMLLWIPNSVLQVVAMDTKFCVTWLIGKLLCRLLPFHRHSVVLHPSEYSV